MKVIALIYILFIVVILQLEKMMYKNYYEIQYDWNKRMRKLNRQILDNSTDINNENGRLIEENYDLREKNRKLEEEIKKSKNRVVEVISEEKTNG